MQIPDKINPDYIRDSIVEIRFDLNSPFEVVIAKFHELFTGSGLTYNSPAFPEPNPNALDFVNFDALYPVFSNDQISIKITSTSIAFNCSKNYLGWKEYGKILRKTISDISDLGIIDRFYRLGIRYINNFEDTNIYDIIKEDMRIKVGNYKTESTSFVTKIKDENFGINLRVDNGVKDDKTGKTLSKIDVDVYINAGQGKIETKELIELLDSVHSKEKEVFFSILNDEFKNSLDAEYKA